MKKILIQLDTDQHPSVFDRIVASDSGADEIFAYGGVEPGDVEGLVHGGMFTRSPKKLRKTAIFVGGAILGGDRQFWTRFRNAILGRCACR